MVHNDISSDLFVEIRYECRISERGRFIINNQQEV